METINSTNDQQVISVDHFRDDGAVAKEVFSLKFNVFFHCEFDALIFLGNKVVHVLKSSSQ